MSEIGISIKQVEAPFFEANSSNRFVLCDVDISMTSAFSFMASFFSFHAICFSVCILESSSSSCLCDIFVDAAYSTAASWYGFVTPRSPFLTGSARISRSSWVHSCSVIAGRKSLAIVFSNGCNRSWMSGSVRRKYVHRLDLRYCKCR